MTRRTSIVEQIGDYFASKGKTLTAEEYKAAEDAPVRFQLVKRYIGSWSRLLNMIEKYGAAEIAIPAPAEEPAPTEEPAPQATVQKENPVAVEKTKGA